MPKTTNSFVEEWVEKFKYYRPYCNPNVLDGRTILIQEYAINFLRTALLESEKRVREETVREIHDVDRLDHYCKCEGGAHFVSFTRENYDGMLEKIISGKIDVEYIN